MLNITIDGHGGSGKSTLARVIAERLNIKVLNTGLIYRAIACSYCEKGLGNPTAEVVDKFMEQININLVFIDDVQKVLIDGKDYSHKLRDEEISILSSQLSKFPSLRARVLDIERDFAYKNDCILEGRSIGSVTLPNADVKLFVTASVEERAKRRMQQFKEKNIDISYEKVLQDLKERDYNDEHRPIAPLIISPDSIIVDSTNMTLEETIEYCINKIKVKINSK